jgi:hypothetical protein
MVHDGERRQPLINKNADQHFSRSRNVRYEVLSRLYFGMPRQSASSGDS